MVGETIRRARQNKGWTQKQFGEKLGFKLEQAQVMVARIESGTRPLPKNKIKLASVLLEVPIEELF